MVSEPTKLSRCAQPPMMLCSTVVQPRNPKSCSLLFTSGCDFPASLVLANDCSTTSRARRLRVATVVGYLKQQQRASCVEGPAASKQATDDGQQACLHSQVNLPDHGHERLQEGAQGCVLPFCSYLQGDSQVNDLRSVLVQRGWERPLA